jgi:hypothetical protein
MGLEGGSPSGLGDVIGKVGEKLNRKETGAPEPGSGSVCNSQRCSGEYVATGSSIVCPFVTERPESRANQLFLAKVGF